VTRYHDRIMLDPVIGILIVASFATLFASAAIHKLRDLAGFDAVFAAYGLSPALTTLHASRIVPVLEIAVALGLLGGASRSYAVATGVVVLSVYGGAIALNLWRGRRDIACGCGGTGEEHPIAAWMVWRNAILAAVLATALRPWSARALVATDAFTIACGVCALALLYLSCERLFGATASRAAQLRSS
jgi:hypothetical protein